MPVFIDSHDAAMLSTDVLRRMFRAPLEPEDHAARFLDFLIDRDGWLHCVTVAPEARAVHQCHAELGIAADTVEQLELE
ncbi:MAG: hypothetical protein M3336_10995, partial [Chloroflexota bacterium]|nr:hypothetical protein [Chloroflexota bacterium]